MREALKLVLSYLNVFYLFILRKLLFKITVLLPKPYQLPNKECNRSNQIVRVYRLVKQILQPVKMAFGHSYIENLGSEKTG